MGRTTPSYAECSTERWNALHHAMEEARRANLINAKEKLDTLLICLIGILELHNTEINRLRGQHGTTPGQSDYRQD